ncbi:lysine decarboxylation/transport transcriptional activator CadC [Yersinia enterocolitica]
MQEPIFRVGEWLVIPTYNKISQDGRQQTLEPRLIDMLCYFARHPGDVLSRDELIDNVWKRNIVTNHVVTQCISELRKYLKYGSHDNLEYIITVPKRGYKLAAAVVWCEEEEEEEEEETLSQISVVHKQNENNYEDNGPDLSLISTAKTQCPFYRSPSFGVWLAFLVTLIVVIIFVSMATVSPRVPISSMPMLLNPRDIDIRIKGGNSCSDWTPQLSYVVGVSELLANFFNSYSTFLVHDQSNYNYNGPSNSGKSLTIEFINQRHYRAQQCFLSMVLVNNADNSIMLDKRYFITANNQLQIQTDIFNNLSEVLKQTIPPETEQRLNLLLPKQGQALQHFYQAHQLLIQGDNNSLNHASEMLSSMIKNSPDFHYISAEKVLVDLLRNSYQPFDGQQLSALQIARVQLDSIPELKDTPIMQQIYTVEALSKGQIDGAYQAINRGIEMQMSWMNYVMLGKSYEMRGNNHLAADSYITAFNLRPGENTLYWIKNGLFQTSIRKVVPYLDNYNVKNSSSI